MRIGAAAKATACVALAAFVTLAALAPRASAEVGQPAFVQSDATLRIHGKTVRLFGIHIPLVQRTCRTFLRPARCAPRAALALDRKIHSFVFCEEVGRNPDGSISAICRVRSNSPTYGPREDLAAYLLRQGWAVALPGAPIDYFIFEEIARLNGRGMWGFQADSIRVR